MGLLNSDDKEKIKRALPKAANKIIDVTVARLYIAYPDPQEWQYTGLSGAIAIVDDIVGHTFFLKLVDIQGHRGVLWDQELYVNFDYNQDRTFFHTFELEECFAGLLFENLDEASHFLKRVQKREKYASKKTLSNKNAIALTKKVKEEEESHPIYGPRGESLITDQRQRYKYDEVEPIPSTKKKAPPPPPPSEAAPSYESRVQSALEEESSSSDLSSDFASASNTPAPQDHQTKYRVPPPLTQFPQSSAAPGPPGPPAPAALAPPVPPSPASTSTAFPSMAPQYPSPPQRQNNPFPIPVPQPMQQQTIPPPFMQANRPQPSLPSNNSRPLPAVPPRGNAPAAPLPRRGPAPPPPPRRTTTAQTGFPSQNVAPSRLPSSNGGRPGPPPPPRRGPAPPPPPRSSRNAQTTGYAPVAAPQQSMLPVPQQQAAQQANTTPFPQAGMPLPSSAYAQQGYSTSVPAPPVAPPMSQQIAAPPPPPPPMPVQSTSAPPPPPPAFLTQAQAPQANTQAGTQNGLTESTGDAGRDALLASIRGTGGVNALRKTDKSQLEKPSVLLQEVRGEPTTTSHSGPPAGGANGGGAPASLADALAAALNQRKSKVAHTEDDYDNGDDW